MRQISELRKDIVTGDWVVVATGRARRPHEYALVRDQKIQALHDCPFEEFQETALVAYDREGAKIFPRKREDTWFVQVIPNKYPAFGHGVCAVERSIGPYRLQDGVGFHEVVVTRDHIHAIADMSVSEVAVIIRAYRDRYRMLASDGCVEYISIFHNNGHEAGATISHPHSQVIAIPVIPPQVGQSIRGSKDYFQHHKECVHCTMIAYEREAKERLVYENEHFIVFCPFASRSAFEMRIFPKVHTPTFESIDDVELRFAADALAQTLQRLSKGLQNPAYNFFIHTAPVGLAPDHYHWHIEIVPKTAIWAGFEISTGIEISTIAPESAAQYLATM